MDILLVENNLDDARAFREALEKISKGSFRIDRAGNLADALGKISHGSFDVIVTDLNLPDSTGNDTVLEICRIALKVPLIVLTEINDEEIELNAMKAGAQDYLVKGRIDQDSLMRTIRHSIERKHLDWELRQARRNLRILHDAASRLETCTMKKSAYELAIESAKLLLPEAMCQIFTEKDGVLTVVATSPELRNRLGNRTRLDFGLAGMTFAENRTFQFSSNEEMPVMNTLDERYMSGISIPIGSHAVFQCLSNRSDEFTSDDTSMLEMLGGHLAETVDRISLERKLRNLAIHDPLTGVFNRNFFQIALNREKLRAERYESSIGFLMVDIDNFKEINDLYGHLAGDKILREVANYLSASVRETDYLIRYGGDEFIMILIETGQTATVVRDRILEGSRLAERSIKLIGKPVTLSIGHSHWDSKTGVSIRETLAEADRRMYAHKNSKQS
jgi:two-component system cell cycle response regulator